MINAFIAVRITKSDAKSNVFVPLSIEQRIIGQPERLFLVPFQRFIYQKMLEDRSYCVYCGDFNECQDHVTPVCWNSVNRKMNKTMTVDCCNMCNGLAGDFVAFTVLQKAAYLLGRYQNKYGAYNSEPKWTLRQIAQLSEGFLKEYIKRENFLHALISGKLKNLELSANGVAPIPLRCYDTAEVFALTQIIVEGDNFRRLPKAERQAKILANI